LKALDQQSGNAAASGNAGENAAADGQAATSSGSSASPQ
jgi:hypothetical protein